MACPTTQEYKDFSLTLHRQAAATKRVVKAQVELTYGCNLHCVHCYTDCYNTPELIKKERSTEEILHTLDQLHEEGVLWICFTGGEIFMRRDFLQIYDYAKEKGFLITLFTNGTMFTGAIVDHLNERPPFSIEISCHGATAETFDRVTQVPGSFQRFLAGIELLRSRGLPFKLKASAMTVNRHELDQIRAFAEGLGVPFNVSPTIYPRLNGDLTPCEYRLTPDEIVALEYPESEVDANEDEATCQLERGKGAPGVTGGATSRGWGPRAIDRGARSVSGRSVAGVGPRAIDRGARSLSGRSVAGVGPRAIEYGADLRPPPDNRLFRCGCGTTSVHISAWGKLGACTFVNEPRANLGEKSVAEAITEVFPQIRGATYQTDTPCRACHVYTLCNKMPSIAAAENGDREQPVEHFCRTAFKRAERLAPAASWRRPL